MLIPFIKKNERKKYKTYIGWRYEKKEHEMKYRELNSKRQEFSSQGLIFLP